jgi:putative flippase GtrA
VKLLALRWLRFNFVGALGIGVQLAALAVFKDLLDIQYLAATALAVELAVLHNFAWHCRFTWKDRPGGTRETLLRLVRFHLGNGVISIGGNLALMWLLAGHFGIHYLAANAIAIAVCSFGNFAAGEWFVFRGGGAEAVTHFSKPAGAGKG